MKKKQKKIALILIPVLILIPAIWLSFLYIWKPKITRHGTFSTLNWDVSFSYGDCTIEKYRGSNPNPRIPQKILGCPVTKIGFEAFKDKKIKTLKIPNGMTGTSENAYWWSIFADTGLVNIEVDPDNPYLYSKNGILYNKNNELIYCPPNYPNGEEVILNDINSIAQFAFKGSKLGTVIINSGSISYGAFLECTIDTLEINYDFRASYISFSHCTIDTLQINSDIPRTTEQCFLGCSINKVILSHDIEHIPSYLFVKCEIRSLTLPSSLTSIEPGVFPRNQDFDFYFDYNPEYFTYQGGMLICKDNASIVWVAPETEGIVQIPDGVKIIPDYTFSDFTSITEVIIPASVTEIESYAFCRCFSLTKINIPASVETVGNSCFSGCDNLQQVLVEGPDTVFADDCFEFAQDDDKYKEIVNFLYEAEPGE